MNKIILISIIAILVFSSCDENERLLYDKDDAALNFSLPRLKDSLSVNFVFVPSEQNTKKIQIKVDLMGRADGKDRQYSIKAIANESTAESGVHYTAFKNNYTFRADSITDMLELELIRDKSLLDNSVRLYVELVPTDDFTLGAYKNQFFILNITDNLVTEPPFWKALYMQYKAGSYHVLKCKKFIEIAGVDSPDWKPEVTPALDIYVKKCRAWFEENPTYDETGKRLYFEYGK